MPYRAKEKEAPNLGLPVGEKMETSQGKKKEETNKTRKGTKRIVREVEVRTALLMPIKKEWAPVLRQEKLRTLYWMYPAPIRAEKYQPASSTSDKMQSP